MRLLRVARLALTEDVGVLRAGGEGIALVPVILLAAVFLLDFSQPADIVFSVLYVLPIVSTALVGRPAATYLAFAVSSVATVAAAAFGAQPEHISAAFSNRALALLAQVVAACAVIQQLALREQDQVIHAVTVSRPLDPLVELSAALAPLPTALAVLQLDGVVRSCNETALRLFGLRVARAVGSPWSCLLPLLQPTALDGTPLSLPPALDAWPASGPQSVAFDVVVQGEGGGPPIRCALIGMVLRDGMNTPFGALVIASDLTESYARDQQRDAFVSMAAHELRAPLSTLRGYTQMAQMQAVATGQHTIAETLGKALGQADRLNRMIGELLDVARLHRGQIELHCLPTDLGVLLRDAIEQRRAADPSRPIILEADDAIPPLLVDGQRLHQVFANLLDNAIKYSPGGGPVEVRLQQSDEDVHISVTDHGIGIPPEEQSVLFQQFSRGKSGARRFSGLGVGLYISNQIVIRHGGTMQVRSTPGEGSTFICCLPLRPPSGRLLR